MKTKFIILIVIIFQIECKAQEVDTLMKKEYIGEKYNSSIGVGINSFGSLISLTYDLFFTSYFYINTSVGTTPFFNGGRKGLSIGLCPGFVIFRRNKYNITFSTGITYSNAFNSNLSNTRSLNNENILNFASGGLPISYKNLFTYFAYSEININVTTRIVISLSLSYYYHRRFQNVDILSFPTLRNRDGLIPNLKIKFQF